MGSDEASHASNISAAYVAGSLRSGEYVSGRFGSVQQWAECCLQVRTPATLVASFKFEQHPLVQQRYDEGLSAGAKPSKYLSHRDVRAIFYRSDAVSQFNKLEAYKKAIENQNAYITNELNKSSVSPFLAFREDETLELQANLVRSRYMLEHFKVLGDELN